MISPYKNVPNNLSYTIVRPGMLSPGEKRGYKEVEFNQCVSKSGIISRIDLADVLVSAAETDNGARKTFEVYYKDKASSGVITGRFNAVPTAA